MDQQKEKEKDDKKPAVPTLRQTTEKGPQLKIKGLKAGQSILERLKQFKKKDLAFILAGLGVLFMAPLAEHFLMSPDNGEGAFKEGWNVKPGAGGLGGGGSPFEPGAGGVAPGDLAGGGSDVITPLNVRDPSALIMGPGATAQPPATTSAAGGAPAKESSDWKDALSQSAAHAASAATHSATPLPPMPPMSGGGLRGLGAVSGGGGASYSLPPINASNVPNHGGGGGSLGLAKAAPGYAGARSNTSSGGMDQLKARAGEAGADFNRAGSAGSALQAAANHDMGSGSDLGGAGQGGQGLGQDKAGGQSQSKDSKSEGESLAFLAAKQNQEKAIELKWKLIDKKAMLWPDLKQKMVEEMMMTPLKKFTEKFTDSIGDFMGGKSSSLSCAYIKEGDTTIPIGAGTFKIDKDKIAKVACSAGGDKDQPQWEPTGTANVFRSCGSSHQVIACLSSDVKPSAGGPNSAPPAPGFAADGSMDAQSSAGLCADIQGKIDSVNKASGSAGDPRVVDDGGKVKTYAPKLLIAAQALISVQDAILKDSSGNTPYDPSGDCAGAKPLDEDDQRKGFSAGASMVKRMANVQKNMQIAVGLMDDYVTQSQAMSDSLLKSGGKEIQSLPDGAPLGQDLQKIAAYLTPKKDPSKLQDAVAAAGNIANPLLANAEKSLGADGKVFQDWSKLTGKDNPLDKARADVDALGGLVQSAQTALGLAQKTVRAVSGGLGQQAANENANVTGLRKTADQLALLADNMSHKLGDTDGLANQQKDYGDPQNGYVSVAIADLAEKGANNVLRRVHDGAQTSIDGEGACGAQQCSLKALSAVAQKIGSGGESQDDDNNFLAAIGKTASAAPSIPANAAAVKEHLALTSSEKASSDSVSVLKQSVGVTSSVAQNSTALSGGKQ